MEKEQTRVYPHFIVDGKHIQSVGCPELDALGVSGYPIGEDMAVFGNGRGPLYIVNMKTDKYRKLIDAGGHVVGFKPEDFDLQRIGRMAQRHSFRKMVVEYAGLERYNDFRGGVCCFGWMLYPEGRYFADEDGFGAEDNDEEEIYCIIDSDLNVLVPFQPMTDDEILLRLKEEAEKRGNKG